MINLASTVKRSLRFVLCVGIAILPLACGDESETRPQGAIGAINVPPPPKIPGGTPTQQPSGDALPLDGEALYAQYCASCHNPLATSTRLGSDQLAIEAAIAAEPAMSGLKFLDEAELGAIAEALSIEVPTEADPEKAAGKGNGKAKGKKAEPANTGNTVPAAS